MKVQRQDFETEFISADAIAYAGSFGRYIIISLLELVKECSFVASNKRPAERSSYEE
jgi:hypothetical protein